MRRIALAAMVVIAATGPARAAETISEAEFRQAAIQMDAGGREPMQNIEALIACLANWSAGGAPRDNKVEITRTGADRFTISALLRSATSLYFEVTRERGAPVALLRRIQYFLPDRQTYQQFTDAETKRTVLHSACPRL
jgi:hypothetical protein